MEPSETRAGLRKNSARKSIKAFAFAGLIALFCAVPALADDTCLVIFGMGGLPEYEENFVSWSEKLESLFREQENREVRVLDGRTQRRDEILKAFQEVSSSASPDSQVWVFLIGHANHDGMNYKFQIRGPDLTDKDLAKFLDSLGNRKTLLVAATSASGALLPDLSSEDRVVITATKNQLERQPPLFLSFFIEASSSPEADTDKNRRVSLLEAFLFSQEKVRVWFKEQGRLQTEHSLLDDQARIRLEATTDESPELTTGAGMLSAMVYLSDPPESAYRSQQARELAGERTVIERNIEVLKFRKQEMDTEQYYSELQELLVQLATINERISELEGK